MVLQYSGRGVGTPQIVHLLEVKSGEKETDHIRTSGRGVEECTSEVIWVLASEKEMTRNDEDKVLVLFCNEWVQDD